MKRCRLGFKIKFKQDGKLNSIVIIKLIFAKLSAEKCSFTFMNGDREHQKFATLS